VHPLRILRETGHAIVEQNKALLAEDIVFHSPLLVKAVTGRDVVAAIFATSASVREGWYIAEHKLDDRTTFLWWKGTIGGHEIESFDVLVDDAQGMLKERTAAYRPFPAVAVFCAEVYPKLKDVLPPDVWEYPTK
jgi:hypothetical protein